MKIKKISRATEKTQTWDVNTSSGAYALPNGCISHNSSVVINSTNGVNLAKQLIIIKESKAGSFAQVVPEYRRLKKNYQLLWDQKDCIEYLKTVAVLQVYVDQGISTDTFYNPTYFEGGKIPATLVAKNLMLGHKYGLKSFYYSLLNKEATKEMANAEPVVILNNDMPKDDDDFCESCVL